MASALRPLTITDEEVRSKFPEDQELANEMATEMIRAVLIRQHEPNEMKLENRPDWQQALDEGMRDVRSGQVVSQEEHLTWKRQQR